MLKNDIKITELRKFLKFLKKKNIKVSDTKIPLIILQISYTFIWEIFIKAKLLAYHSNRRKINENDLKFICKEIFHSFRKNNSNFNKPYFKGLVKNFQYFGYNKHELNDDIEKIYNKYKYRDVYKIKSKNLYS
jgi:histone H3/H4